MERLVLDARFRAGKAGATVTPLSSLELSLLVHSVLQVGGVVLQGRCYRNRAIRVGHPDGRFRHFRAGRWLRHLLTAAVAKVHPGLRPDRVGICEGVPTGSWANSPVFLPNTKGGMWCCGRPRLQLAP